MLKTPLQVITAYCMEYKMYTAKNRFKDTKKSLDFKKYKSKYMLSCKRFDYVELTFQWEAGVTF